MIVPLSVNALHGLDPGAGAACDVRADRLIERICPPPPPVEALLPGELLDTDARDDAAHRATVYEELTGRR